MSNFLREIVELTLIGGSNRKAAQDSALKTVLIHVADTVRNDDLRYFRSKNNAARRTGYDVKTIRRKLSDLVDAGILVDGGTKRYPPGIVDVYLVNLDAILALPCIQENDSRRELAAKLTPAGVGTGCPEVGPHSPEVASESRPNHKEPYLTKDLPRKQNANVIQSVRDDHLVDDKEFEDWVKVVRSRNE